jgi:drug/metabolite transporter (DMT)-like permease
MPSAFLILACAFWALSFPLLKALQLEQSHRLPGVSSIFLSSWVQFARFATCTLMLLPFVIARKRPRPNEIRQGMVIAVWSGMGMWLQADALNYTEASTSAFLTQAYCIFLPLWACIRLRRAPEARIIIATLMVLIGGAILAGLRPGNLQLGRGEIETLVAAFIFTFQILTLENPRYQENCGIQVSFVMFLSIAILFIPITLLTAPDVATCFKAGASQEAMILVVGLALFCSVGGYVLMNIWQPKVTATEAGLIYTTEPVFTACYVLFLPTLLGLFIGIPNPNELLTTQKVIGGSLILVATAVVQLKSTSRLQPVEETPSHSKSNIL